MTEKLLEHLDFIYGDQGADVVARTHERLRALLLQADLPPPRRAGERLSERDAVLITYGDQIRREGEAPLETLGGFLQRRLTGVGAPRSSVWTPSPTSGRKSAPRASTIPRPTASCSYAARSWT